MSSWKVALSAAVLAVALVAPAAYADDYSKLTLLTFSAPVDLPGITLPAGTYRFALADPETGRRVIKVSDKDGTKQLGMFLSIPNERMKPTDKPVVMFREAAAGAPPAVQAWFYPAESFGYEFVYPHDQALKIAKATHQPVLSQTGNEVARIDENDKPVSTDEALKESSAPRTAVATSGTSSAATRTPAATSGTASASPAPAPMMSRTETAAQTPAPSAKPVRKHLPRTASPLPLLALLSGMSLLGAFGVRAVRQSL